MCPGHHITSAFLPNADEILPWRMKFNIRPPKDPLAGKKLGCFNLFLALADKINYLGDTIQNLSATLAGTKCELCLALHVSKVSTNAYPRNRNTSL